MEKPYICELCGKKLADGIGIVLPQDMIARIELEEELVEDPTCLRFCSKRCSARWSAMKQGSIWNEHPADCMCLSCFR